MSIIMRIYILDTVKCSFCIVKSRFIAVVQSYGYSLIMLV